MSRDPHEPMNPWPRNPWPRSATRRPRYVFLLRADLQDANEASRFADYISECATRWLIENLREPRGELELSAPEVEILTEIADD